jgi:L,D-transpeptidase-like protein
MRGNVALSMRFHAIDAFRMTDSPVAMSRDVAIPVWNAKYPGGATMDMRKRRERTRDHSITRSMVRTGLPLLLMLLVTACSAGGASVAHPTRTPTQSAAKQDIVQISPTPVPTAPTRPPVKNHKSNPTGVPTAPSTDGHVILVSLSRQTLYAYENGVFVFSALVETGRPALPTPTGVYHVFLKACSDLRWVSNSAPTSMHNVNCTEHNGDGYQEVFTSPWPEGSPYWYAPTHINYALKFRADGFYLHDAWWHQKFGPGGNVPHQLPDGSWETGSHGCVGMTTASAQRLYAWAPVGTTVYIRADV